MSDATDIALRQFIAEHIHSVAALELLLLLHREAPKQFSASEAARIFALAPEMTTSLLDDLCKHGLVTCSAEQGAYWYQPGNARIDPLITQLNDMYRERRVALIQLIYAPPVDNLRRFADAFELRQKKKGDE